MQRLYSYIFNCIYKHFTCHINEHLRMILVSVCIALMTGILLFNRTGELNDAKHEMITAILILLIIVFSISGDLRQLEWNKAVFYPFVLFGLSIVAVSFIHRTGLILLAIEFIFLLPALYYVWMNSGRIAVYYNIVSISVVLEGIISLVFCFLLSEQGQAFVVDDRYAGFSGGPNQLGEIGVAILIAGLYVFFIKENGFPVWILSAAGIGTGISYAVISSCRTAMLAELVCISSAVIYSIKLHIIKREYTRTFLAQTAITILLSAGVIYIGLQLDNINYENLQMQNTSGSMIELSRTPVNDPITVVAYAQTEEQNSIGLLDRFSYNGDINSLSSGRIYLWKLYLENSAPLGKDDYWEPSTNYEGKMFTYPAHNNIVEYTYRCGYLSGAIYIILYIVIMIAGLKLLFKRTNSEYYLIFCIMCIGSFSIYALIEWAAIITRVGTCMYYLSLAPIMLSASGSQAKRQ